ncbi:hypothetical protein ScPMuIL_012818 [Solemya velum]
MFSHHTALEAEFCALKSEVEVVTDSSSLDKLRGDVRQLWSHLNVTDDTDTDRYGNALAAMREEFQKQLTQMADFILTKMVNVTFIVSDLERKLKQLEDKCSVCGEMTGENEVCDPDSCLNGGFCHVFAGSYKCACVVGYTGKYCENRVDACVVSPCRNNGTCTSSTGNSYTCTCAVGYKGVDCELDTKAQIATV